ncbi:MAG TPA: TolC family protein [Usitatibacter sp.]|nr:TolC family protein [Usitatibacter sp.]
MHLILRRARIAWLVAAMASPLGALAAGAPLGLAEAQSLAVARSPQVAGLGHAADAARETAVAAGELPDPTLKMQIQNLPLDGPDAFSLTGDFMTMRSIGVMQELTGRDKRELRARHSGLEAEKSLAQRSLAIANVLRDAALAWLDRRYSEAMRAAIDEQANAARMQIEAADSAYRAARGSQADVFAARSAVAMLEDRASEADRRIRAAKLALARWIGADAERPLAGEAPIDRPPLPEHDLRAHIERHPDLEVLEKREEIAANDVKLAAAARHPDWSVELMYSQRGPAFSNMVSIGVSVPLPWDRPHRQDREVAAKLALQEQAREEREDMLRAHVADVGAMMAEWRAGRERLGRYAKEILPLAAQRTQAALAGYRGGKSSLVEVLAARRDELDARLQALQLEWDNARAWAQLAFLIPGEDPARMNMKEMK